MSTELPRGLIQDFFRIGGAPPSLKVGSLRSPGQPVSRSSEVACRIVELREGAVAAASEAICRAYPYAAMLGPEAESKCRRDLAIVVDYVALGIAYESQAFLHDRMLHWFRIVLQHLAFPEHEDSIRGCYSILRQEIMSRLNASEWAVAQPYLDLVVRILARDETMGADIP